MVKVNHQIIRKKEKVNHQIIRKKEKVNHQLRKKEKVRILELKIHFFYSWNLYVDKLKNDLKIK